MTNQVNRTYIRCIQIFAAGALFVSCRNEISEIRALDDPRNLPVQTSYNAKYRYTERGKIKNELSATQLDQYTGEEGFLEASGGFTMVFYDSLEKEDARLTATNGRYYEKERRLIAWDNVRLYNRKGEMLETEEIIFAQDSSRIYTNKFVSIYTETDTLYGQGIESNDSFTRYRIIKPVGSFYVNEPSDSLK